MSKKTALFIPSPIRSHVLPSFYLAELLSEEYDIVYAVGNHILEELCIENGFKCFTIGGFKIGLGMEERYIREKYGKTSFTRLFMAYFSNELYSLRKDIYDRIVQDWKPDLVILDVFTSTEFFILNQYSGLKIAFFNPMPSIYNVDEDPTVLANAPIENKPKSSKISKTNLLSWFTGARKYIMRLAGNFQYDDLIKKSGIAGSDTLIRSKFTLLFKDIPEIILVPEEFEFRLGGAKHYQFYLGLCQREGRVDTELDALFSEAWPDILKRKDNGERIIYCSFGTFFEGADRSLLNFVKLLSIALKGFENTHLVCSVNKYVIGALKSEGFDSDRVSLFSRVPQPTVLQNATAFITHGGMGGIKESIFYQVPMLVFPLDFSYDQNDNALKVEYHQLGIRGVFQYERVDGIKKKLKEILENKTYRESLRKFKAVTDIRYSRENVRHLLKENFSI
ncbi:glycosyltransferase [Dyadobacter arcticus]|uniref:UDP:flavonoid glycosyltransferase YjiC (YdhE family) n=1 Tax=Dyadobacter arcticus TaxID=1078754 RepID=A0ABX0UJK2_9BACT|nr:glycosyltransferase [Dyadobacter arcticus]NIJ52987.1 UDP:flavonoid glycosyltransferase YjiC (YdhE family) [Dyadobacter arcticus]